jgi:hypothetical protein
MPDDTGRPLSDGRLNLEQQKKRAKELLKAMRAGDPSAQARMRERHPHGARLDPSAVQLADAQAVISREAGFASWPRLKAHAERLGRARAAMSRPDAAPDTSRTLHLRCGSDLKAPLERAGFVGGFLEFADPYCQGPVRDLPTAALVAERADFLTQAYGLTPSAARRRLEREYAALDALGEWDELVLWFEHDIYDQLIMARLLATLPATRPVFLVCVDHSPGVARFLGLGQLAPEVIRLHWEQRTAVEPAHRALGRQVWAALTQDSPEALHRIVLAGTPAVPPMAGALARHLRELPSARNGLSLTEQLTLDVLAELGATPARRLFQQLNREREPLPFMGDAMFWVVLRALSSGPARLIDAGPAGHHDTAWAERTISLTADGEAVRSDRADWLALGAPVRWLGGVELDPARPCWRWDEPAARPVLTTISKD